MWLQVTNLLFVTGVKGASDERELRKEKLNESVYDPGVIPGEWRKENIADFENLGAFVEKKCQVYNQVNWAMKPGASEIVHYFSHQFRC